MCLHSKILFKASAETLALFEIRAKICYNIKKPKNFQKSLHTFKNIGTTIYEGPFKNARKEASYGTSKQTDGESTDG